MKKNNKKPVVLITGYLGSGKTTLLNNLLRQEKHRDALIVNDMGSINVDAVNASFLSYEEDNPKTKVYLTSVVTVVDADRIEFCNFIVLNKCDLLNADQPKEVEAIIRDSQPSAPIFHSVNGNIDIDQITTTEPFNRERFMNFVNTNYTIKLTLAKGYIWFSDADANVQLFEQAGRNSSVMTVAYWINALEEKHKQEYLEYNPDVKEAWDEEFGDRVNQLVIIGKGYNKEAITAALRSYLDEKAIA